MPLDFKESTIKAALPSTELWRNRCVSLGSIAIVRCLRPNLPALDATYIHTIFDPAFRHGQLAIWVNHMDAPVAYAIWASLDDATLSELMINPLEPLHLSEWAEGSRLCILDAVAAPGYASYMVKQMLEMSDFEEVIFIRRRKSFTSLNAIDRKSAMRLVSLLPQ